MPGPDEAVMRAFGVTSEPKVMTGGQGNAFQSDHVVLKESQNEIEVEWSSQVLTSVKQEGFRLASPIQAISGSYWFQGWSAQTLIAGKTIKGEKFAERLEASKSFNLGLKSVLCPSFLEERTDPWAIADRVTWRVIDWEAHPAIVPVLRSFRELEEPISVAHQVIHGDIAGNFLYEADLTLGIIDFSPYWNPVGFGEAVFVVDVILWEGASFDEMLLLANCDSIFFQLIVRAAIRRLLEIDCQHRVRMRDDVPKQQVERYFGLAKQLTLASKRFLS